MSREFSARANADLNVLSSGVLTQCSGLWFYQSNSRRACSLAQLIVERRQGYTLPYRQFKISRVVNGELELFRQGKYSTESIFAALGIDTDRQSAQVLEKPVHFLPADASPANGHQ